MVCRLARDHRHEKARTHLPLYPSKNPPVLSNDDKTESYQQYDYKYIFDVHGRDVETGDYTVRTMSFGSDTRFSPDEIEEEYSNILRAEQEYYEDQHGFLPDVVELAVVTRKGVL